MVVPVGAVPDRVLDRSLADADPEVHGAISAELTRQQTTLEMIASENFAPVAVMQAQGSVLTDKYAEGYPRRRCHGGCEHVDDDFAEVSDVIATALRPSVGEELLAELRTRVTRLADRHPLYPDPTEVPR